MKVEAWIDSRWVDITEPSTSGSFSDFKHDGTKDIYAFIMREDGLVVFRANPESEQMLADGWLRAVTYPSQHIVTLKGEQSHVLEVHQHDGRVVKVKLTG